MAAEELDVREESDGSAVIVDPSEQTQAPPQQAQEQHEDDDTDPPGDAPSDEETEALAAEEAAASSDEEREQIRERRRQERRAKKEHQKQLVADLKAEVEAERRQRMELAQRLAAIEQRNSSADIAAVDNAIRQIDQFEVQLKDALAEAVKNQNGMAVADITDKMLNAKRERDRLAGVKQSFAQRQSAPPPLAPELASNAQAWMQKNDWYKPQNNDLDSQIVRAIDSQVAQEGFDPRTPAYWTELQRRVEQRLPHRYRSQNVTTTPKTEKPARTPVTGSGRDSSAAPAQNTYRLSAERVQALKDAGMWEDPKTRAEMIKQYREFDKKNSDRS